MLKQKEHLSMYGVGPLYGGIIVVLTILGMLAAQTTTLASGNIPFMAIPFTVLGVFLMLAAVCLWVRAVWVDKLDDGILHNKLLTNGIYGWTRNPIYLALLFLCTGVLLMAHNLWLLLLPIVFCIVLTVLLKRTEEKWLMSRYGKEYEAYCHRVNRCMPWFPKKER